jgi:hypothetical protein
MRLRFAAMLIVTFLWSIPGVAQALDAYVGTYQVAPGVKVAIVLEGGRLLARYGFSQALPLVPVSETKFRLPQGAIDLEL